MGSTVLWAPCRQCRNWTRHEVLYEVDQQEFDQEDEGIQILSGVKTYQTIRCLGCEEISFRLHHSSVHLFDIETQSDRSIVESYPDPELDHRHPALFMAVPDNLEKLYIQTVRAYNQKMEVLCAGGLRALIDGLCSEEGVIEGEVPKKRHDGSLVLGTDGVPETVRTRNLEGKIGGLVEKGLLTKPHAQALQEHRYIGNEALHELRTIPRDELLVAIEIIEQTFNTIYEVPYKQKLLERRRTKRSRMRTE